jgi:ribosome recycling factor
MHQEILNNLKSDLEKTVESFKSEIARFRTGKATPALVENLQVDYYGQKMPLKHIAAISAPQAKTIVIQPWDKNAVIPIQNAIQNSGLGVSPIVDGQIIRINLPALSEESRRGLVKILHQEAEECRITARQQREEVWKKIQDLAGGGEIREDDKFRAKEEIQKTVDGFNEKIKELAEKKEEEIMTA